MNLLIIHSNPHVALTIDLFILDRVSKTPVLVPRGDNPHRVTLHLVNPLITCILYMYLYDY